MEKNLFRIWDMIWFVAEFNIQCEIRSKGCGKVHSGKYLPCMASPLKLYCLAKMALYTYVCKPKI